MWRRATMLVLVLLVVHPRPLGAYSVLTHEAIVDAVWDDSIVPLLRARFHPSPAELREARAYTYGGCIIQDMGYYPLSSRTFGDLVHYVRSGDFVIALLRESKNLDEYAFALGALAHFAADNTGHPAVINRAVPMLYPKLRAKFGNVITYEDDPAAHLKTEFGFDVVQVARGSYEPQAYHDFIGFQVSKPVLERAFKATYGLELGDVFASVDLAIGTFRHTVSTLLPSMTKVAWDTKQKEIAKLTPGATRDHFLYLMPTTAYEREWGATYSRPNIVHKILAFFFRLIPKIGPFKSLSFKPPTPEAERLFLQSFSATVRDYRALLGSLGRHDLALRNRNFDTGGPIAPGSYRLVDEIYARLVDKLADHHFESVPPRLRADILAFYAHPDAPIATKQDRKAWQKLQQNLDALQGAPAQGRPGRR